MDREPEELQFLGAFGIMGEANKVLRSCAKVLGLITLTLVLPLSFVILAHGLIMRPLFHKIAMNYMYAQMNPGSPAAEKTLHQISLEWGEVFLIEVAYLAFVFVLSLLSMSAVVYTVACLYTGKELSYGRVMSVVPRVWKRLMMTILWFFAVLFAYYVVLLFVLLLWLLINGSDGVRRGTFWIVVLVIMIVFFSVNVYISMIWQLASVVSVLEERYGLGAMKKAMDLIKGKRVTALLLNLLYAIFVGVVGNFFRYDVVVEGAEHQVGVGKRVAYGSVLVVVQCGLNLMGLLIQTVFYFVCKSYHHESIDKTTLSDHLEAYLGEYMPLKGGISNIQLQDLDP